MVPLRGAAVWLALWLGVSGPVAAAVVDLTRHERSSGVGVEVLPGPDENLRVEWPAAPGETGQLILDTRPGRPLFRSIGLRDGESGADVKAILKDVHPVTFLTVGTRSSPPDRPPGMSVFNVF